MDWEIFGFLIFVVIYLVATISEKTKKHKEKAEKKTKQTVLPAQAFESDEEEADDLPEEEQPTAASDDPCKQEEQPPIHLHQVTEQQFEAAQEGEDPCHAGGVTAVRLEHHDGEEASEADLEAMRQDSDILRGVIMSEVLMRPAERAALRRIRRGKRT